MLLLRHSEREKSTRTSKAKKEEFFIRPGCSFLSRTSFVPAAAAIIIVVCPTHVYMSEESPFCSVCERPFAAHFSPRLL